MIQKREEIQGKLFQNFKAYTSQYKDIDKRQQKEIDLQFQKQEQQEKEALQQELKDELRLENRIRLQEEVDKETVVVGSAAAVNANYLNERKKRQEIDLQSRIQEQ